MEASLTIDKNYENIFKFNKHFKIRTSGVFSKNVRVDSRGKHVSEIRVTKSIRINLKNIPKIVDASKGAASSEKYTDGPELHREMSERWNLKNTSKFKRGVLEEREKRARRAEGARQKGLKAVENQVEPGLGRVAWKASDQTGLGDLSRSNTNYR